MTYVQGGLLLGVGDGGWGGELEESLRFWRSGSAGTFKGSDFSITRLR